MITQALAQVLTVPSTQFSTGNGKEGKVCFLEGKEEIETQKVHES